MFRVQNRLRAFLNPFSSEKIYAKTGLLHMVSCNNPVFIVYAVYNLQRLAELLQVGAELLADLRML